MAAPTQFIKHLADRGDASGYVDYWTICSWASEVISLPCRQCLPDWMCCILEEEKMRRVANNPIKKNYLFDIFNKN